MRADHATVPQDDELVLPPTFDGSDGCASQSAQRSRAEAPSQGGVQQARVLDGFPHDSRAEQFRGTLDFGQLWHGLVTVDLVFPS